MSTQINQITTEATTLNDDSFFPVDSEVSTVFTTKKIKWGTFKSLLNILPLNNTWTGTNRFNKQVKVVSDGTNSPLVVRDSTDTSTILEMDNANLNINGTYRYLKFNSGISSPSAGGIAWGDTGTDYRWIMVGNANKIDFVRNLLPGQNVVSIYENQILTGQNAYVSVAGEQSGYGALLSGGQITGGAYSNNLSIAPNYYHYGVNGGTLTLSCADGVNQTSMLEYTTSTAPILKLIKNKGQLIIGGTTPHASAIFQTDSTTKGILIPRMTTTQRNAISSPATSLLLFNTTTNQYEWYNGTAWVGLGDLLPLNNTWTGTNRFNKQVKVVSDGTNSPLVVMDSTDTTTLFAVGPTGYFNVSSGLLVVSGVSSPESRMVSSLGGSYSYILRPGGLNELQLTLNGNNAHTWNLTTKGQCIEGSLIISDTYSAINTSAKFQIDSTTKGILIPRMTTTQRNAISSPATGLELWDTTANTKSYKKSGGWSYAGLITETQYDRPYIGVDITVTNGSEFNLLTKIAETDKNNAVTDAFNPLVIASNNIKTQWTGAKQIHFIRLNFDILTGNAQFYRVELRRFSDNSVVATKIVSRNPDEPNQTVEFITRTLSATDPYVTGGFYIAFVNNSGATCTVQDAFQLVIINQYQ